MLLAFANLNVLVDLSVEIDEHDEGDDAEDDEPAPVEVHGVEWSRPHLGRLQVHGVVDRLVRHGIADVIVDDRGLEESKTFEKLV
jgi:hypothetical protein